MTKTTTPSFVLSLEMQVNEYAKKLIERDLEISRIIYNTCLGELLKREKQMKRTKKYKKLRRCLRAVSQKLSYYTEKKNEDKTIVYQKEKSSLLKEIFDMQADCGLTEYSMHTYMKPIRKHFQNQLNSIVAQKASTRAWQTFSKKLKGEAKKVKFAKHHEMMSFEGKNNATGWVYKDGQIVIGKTKINLKIKDNDLYIQETLSNINNAVEFDYITSKGELKRALYKVKYVRIIKRIIRGRVRYFAQLIIQGYPLPKRNKDGSFKHQLGNGRVGGDLGTSSVSVVGENDVLLTNLADEVKDISKVIRLVQRKMDRSKRATNPQCFKEDGTIKKGKKTWSFSNKYVKLKARLKELHRKQAAIRKLSHNRLANRILSFGNEHYWEEMNIKALQKRSKKTEISEKTGKYKRKKRFGKSIGNRAPAMFLSILENKVLSQGGTFQKVNTWTFKASQYDHKTNECKKKELKNRWHQFDDGVRVQRDLYSAFLLRNSNKARSKANRKLCNQTFDTFKVLHDKEILILESKETLVLNSGIQLKNKKATVVA